MIDGTDRWSEHQRRRLAVKDWKGSDLKVALVHEREAVFDGNNCAES